MKKKIIYGICGIISVIGIVVMLIFVLKGRDDATVQTINMEGTWKVVVYVKDSSFTLVNNEFMIFNADSVSDYRDDFSIPFATSKYEIDEALEMKLPDISRNYTVKKYTSNYVRLYENKNTYIELIRYPKSDLSEVVFNHSDIIGKWNVTYRNADQIIANEYLIFEEDTMSDYRNGDVEPTVSSKYKWKDNNHLVIDKLGKSVIANMVSDKTIIFVEEDTGYIWELQKAD